MHRFLTVTIHILFLSIAIQSYGANDTEAGTMCDGLCSVDSGNRQLFFLEDSIANLTDRSLVHDVVGITFLKPLTVSKSSFAQLRYGKLVSKKYDPRADCTIDFKESTTHTFNAGDEILITDIKVEGSGQLRSFIVFTTFLVENEFIKSITCTTRSYDFKELDSRISSHKNSILKFNLAE